MSSRRKTVLTMLSLALLVSALSASAETVTMQLPDGGVVRVDVPGGWEARWSAGKGGGGTAEIVQKAGSDSKLLLTVLPVLPPDTPIKDAASLRSLVVGSGERMLPTSLQETLVVEEVTPEGGAGFVYHLTDRNPEKGPGDYREMHQGALLTGGRVMSFTMLSHPGEEKLVAIAMALLRSVRLGS